MALSDAKRNDSQAGFETALGAVLAALAGINIVSGPGMLDYETTISLEKLLIDDEICGLAYRLLAGIAQRDEPIAAPLFETIDPEAKFLVHEHTRLWYRREHSLARLADRDTYETWAAAGAKTMADRARSEVKRMLAEPQAGRAEEGLAAELRRIMNDEAARCGLPPLPPV
jgi:trimethylamine--corrinoid protein Co-methyltransferase